MSRIKLSTLLITVSLAGVGASIPLVAAPSASANCDANQQWDPIIGTCWTKQDRNSMGSPNGANGCRPGALGNCLGAMQNATVPGATLPKPVADDGPMTPDG
jgi:hypothetical protein